MLVHVALDRLCETILDQTLDFPGRRHERLLRGAAPRLKASCDKAGRTDRPSLFFATISGSRRAVTSGSIFGRADRPLGVLLEADQVLSVRMAE